jgi:hypothetical protein
MPTRLLALAVCLLGSLFIWGCGPSCKQIADARSALRAGRKATSTAHLQLGIPHALANRLIAEGLRDVPPVPLELPGVKGLGLLVPALSELRLTVATRSLRLVPAAEDHLGLSLDLELRDGSEVLMELGLDLELRPRLERDAEGQVLTVELEGEGLRAVRPRLGPEPSERLARAIHRRLPHLIRSTVPVQALARVAGGLIERLGADSYALLRSAVLERLGRIKQVRLRLPELPVERVHLRSPRSQVPHLAVDLFTDLPVREGLEGDQSMKLLKRDAVQVRVAGSAVAELSNWAMERGLIPARYDRDLKPKAEGGFSPIFDWEHRQPRPLKIHVFRKQKPCAHVQVGARARVAVKKEKLVLTLEDREMERVQGPPLVRLGVWLDSLWSRALTTTKELAAQTRLRLGGHEVRVRIEQARLYQRELVLGLSGRVRPLRAPAP